MIFRYLLLAFLSISVVAAAENIGLQAQLFADMEDSRLDDFTLIEAAFILSGVQSPDSLRNHIRWYEEMVQNIRAYNFDLFDKPALAQKIFAIMHSNILGEYERESTTLLDIIRRKKFNCVSATILYNLVCADLGLETKAFETPTHVYTIFSDFERRFIVENTNAMGFNIMKNLHTYSQFLLQYYPHDRRLEIGLDQLYAYENSRGRPIDNTELLGLLAYNQAYFAAQKEDFVAAYEFVLTAQQFNADSRSNIEFEKGLYFRWGSRCFRERRFFDAFSVFADGFYRYPENADFAQNTRVAFLNCLQQNWQNRNWAQTRQVIGEILELDILQVEEMKQIKFYFDRWSTYFALKQKKAPLDELNSLLKKIENDLQR